MCSFLPKNHNRTLHKPRHISTQIPSNEQHSHNYDMCKDSTSRGFVQRTRCQFSEKGWQKCRAKAGGNNIAKCDVWQGTPLKANKPSPQVTSAFMHMSVCLCRQSTPSFRAPLKYRDSHSLECTLLLSFRSRVLSAKGDNKKVQKNANKCMTVSRLKIH